MQIVNEWLQVCKIFLPSNAKLFFLITFNTIWQTIKAWFTRWWWLAVLYIFVNAASLGLYAWGMSYARDVALPMAFVQKLDFLSAAFGHVSLGLWVFMFWTLFLAVRPSVLKKTYSYYAGYSVHGIVVLALYGLLFLPVHYVDALYATTYYYTSMGGSPFSPLTDTILNIVFGYLFMPLFPFGVYLGAGNSLIFSPFLILFVFSFLDSQCGVSGFFRSFIRAGRLVLYTYPFLWVVTGVITALVSAKSYLELQVITQLLSRAVSFPLVYLVCIDSISLLVGVFLAIILYSIVSNVYTKQIHEHFERYY